MLLQVSNGHQQPHCECVVAPDCRAVSAGCYGKSIETPGSSLLLSVNVSWQTLGVHQMTQSRGRAGGTRACVRVHVWVCGWCSCYMNSLQISRGITVWVYSCGESLKSFRLRTKAGCPTRFVGHNDWRARGRALEIGTWWVSKHLQPQNTFCSWSWACGMQELEVSNFLPFTSLLQ